MTVSDPYDLLTLDEGKQAVDVAEIDDQYADILPGYITAVSRLLDDRVGACVVRAVTSEQHDVCGRSSLVLRHRPVSAVTSITEYVSGTGTALTAMSVTSGPTDGYHLAPFDGTGNYSGIVHRTSGWRGYTFRGTVTVSYTAGRFQSTTSVDAQFKRAAGICLANLWRDRQQSAGVMGEYDVPMASFPTFAMPRAAADLLAKEIGQHEPWGIA